MAGVVGLILRLVDEKVCMDMVAGKRVSPKPCCQRPRYAYQDQRERKFRILSASLRDMIFRGCYHIRRQQHYSIRTTYYEKSIEIEFAGQTCPWAGAF